MFKLALATGHTVQEIETWPSALISEWIAYDQLDHLPDPWWIGAQICWTLARVMGNKEAKFEDFMPLTRRPVRVMSGEAGKAIFEAIIKGPPVKLGEELPHGERLIP